MQSRVDAARQELLRRAAQSELDRRNVPASSMPKNDSLTNRAIDFLGKPNSPLGLSVATGLMSIAGRNPQEKSDISRMPEALYGKDINTQMGQEIGKFLPSLIGGGSSLISRIGLSAGQGAAMNPEDRMKGLLEGAGTGALTETGLRTVKGIGHIINAIAPEGLTQAIMRHMGSGKTLEGHAQDFAGRLKDTYERVKTGISNKYNKLFDDNNLGAKELYPLKDKLEKGGRQPAGQVSRYYRETPNFSNQSAGPEYQQALEQFNKMPNVKNAQALQSEMSSEERQIGKQIDRARANGQPITQLVNDAKAVKASREKLQNKMHDVMGDKADEYKAITNEYLDKVVPYHGDRALRDILSGRNTNPAKEHFGSIFKNADQDTKKILGDLGPGSENDVLFQAIGHQPEDMTKEDLINRVKEVKRSGFEHYVSKSLKKRIKALDLAKKIPGLALGTGIAGVGFMEGGKLANELMKHLSSE